MQVSRKSHPGTTGYRNGSHVITTHGFFVQVRRDRPVSQEHRADKKEACSRADHLSVNPGMNHGIAPE
jgi:hypothetical protein